MVRPGVGQWSTAAVEQGGDMTVVAVLGHGAVQFRFIFNAFRQFTFRTLIQHTHQGADNFQVT